MLTAWVRRLDNWPNGGARLLLRAQEAPKDDKKQERVGRERCLGNMTTRRWFSSEKRRDSSGAWVCACMCELVSKERLLETKTDSALREQPILEFL